MRLPHRPLLLACAAFVLSVGALQAEVKLPAVLSSHMVLQRELPVPIWGQAEPDEKVTVTFRDQEKTATTDKNGKWLVKLDPLKAGGPDKLVIAGSNTVTLEDVLVGEVWLGSGQSNMEGGVSSYVKGDDVLAKAAAGTYPRLRLKKTGTKGWQEATPANTTGFSALLFAFGLRLQQELDVPVGLMVGAVGGTPSARWVSEEALRADPACKEVIKKFAVTYPLEQLQKKYEQELEQWKKDAEAAKKDGKTVPKKPLAPKKPGEVATGKVGSLYESNIQPFIPFAIRGVLWDQGEGGTAVTGLDQCTLMGVLIASWRKDWGQGDFPFIYIQKPSGGGCAYDRDSPITRKADAFSSLPKEVPSTGSGAFRENHLQIMRYPNTSMAISSDLGSGVHPVNKSGYAARAAQVALGVVYGRKVEYYGPIYKSHEVEDGKVRIAFTHVGQGLEFRHGDKLQGFAVAGEDKVFHWADAVIEGDAVVLTCSKVEKPVAVRYGWGDKHPWANLFNKDTLPALPFRTDAW
jgi:sialate O-acetylesterase